MSIRWMGAALVLCFATVAVAAQDGDAESLRASFEDRFESLDANGNGLLESQELDRVSPAELEALRSHGLPDEFPISRDAYVAAGTAMGLSASAPPQEPADKPAELDSGRDPSSKTPDSGKSDSKATAPVATANSVVHIRNPGKKGGYVPGFPAEYNARDKNGDGQIALYEWDRKKYAEFAKLDKNGDGFLTPAELLPKESLKTLYARTPATAAAAAAGNLANLPRTGNAVVVDLEAVLKEARSTFAQMDEDKDGNIGETEWGRSRRIRPWFESAGITASLPINADTFAAYYRRAKETGTR